jgi:septum formation protein
MLESFPMSHLPLILASNSPRRRELLSLTGLAFEIFPVMIDETPRNNELPESYVMRISEEKAVAAAEKSKKNGILISADTIVVDQGRIIGKPQDENHARQILHGLRDHSHVVHTALIVYNLSTTGMEKDLCSSRVPMRNYSDDEIDDYISSGDPMDKAGAYAVQHAGFHPVVNFKGCFASVMGFPLCHLARTFRRMNISISSEIASICQKHLNYACPIFSEVLDGKLIG